MMTASVSIAPVKQELQLQKVEEPAEKSDDEAPKNKGNGNFEQIVGGGRY